MQATSDGLWTSDESNQKAQILVVDDRQDKLLAFRSILEELDQTIFTARSGEEALKLVLEHEFAVVLLDVNMPGMDGLETAALIRKRKKTAHTPIIFITAYADEMLTMQGYSLGAVDYILSPVVPDILRTKVKVFVDLFCMSQSAKRQAEERIALVKEQTARAAAEEANRRSSFLAEASRTLSRSLDFQATVQELFSVVVPALADVCSLTPVDEHGRTGQTEVTWTTSGERSTRMSVGAIPPALARGVEHALATREPQAIDDHRPGRTRPEFAQSDGEPFESAPALPICSGAIFPLMARGRMLGVLCFALGPSRRVLNDFDWSLMEDLANRAAIALDNALLYQQLQNADDQKSEFLAMLGHELRNPLAPIRNAVEMLRIAGSDPARLNWVQGIIERQVKHLTRLVDDLLDVSRITRGKIELQLASLDVSTVVSAAVETSLPLMDSRKHRLTVLIPPQTLWIRADASRIAQVMGNLLNNAAKYTPEGGRISLTVMQEADEVVFRVADTGIGLSEDMRLRIFDLFAQGERPPNSLQEGLGVGLTLVRRLVELHGGSVDARSAGLNQGSEFVVRLPMLREAEIQSSDATRPAPAEVLDKGLRVLVVDDNKDAAQSTALLLRLAGFEAQLAYDGAEALKAVSEFCPDAVLLDIGLPVMDGYEVARRLRAQPSAQRLVLIAASGYGQEEDQLRSIEAGFDTHLTKPLDPPHLTDLLVSLCPRKS
jgi:signal transduction histidine kinase/DNA-binding response OmpR family regulator